MSPLPNYRPKRLSLGTLETEILTIIWQLNCATVKEIHDQLLADPDRELTASSVTTVLERLKAKGWLRKHRRGRAFYWEALISQEEALAINAYEQLNRFLAIGNPDLVASFADSLDHGSIEQIEAIAERLKAFRQQKQEGK
jgi:predicted transcriptional regulator